MVDWLHKIARPRINALVEATAAAQEEEDKKKAVVGANNNNNNNEFNKEKEKDSAVVKAMRQALIKASGIDPNEGTSSSSRDGSGSAKSSKSSVAMGLVGVITLHPSYDACEAFLVKKTGSNSTVRMKLSS